VEEVEVKLKNIPRKITVVNSSGVQQSIQPDDLHFLLRVTSTESNKIWGIDITGARFGFTKNLWPWDEFLKSHVETVEAVVELGTSPTIVPAFSSIRGMPSVRFGIPRAAMDQVNLALQVWEEIEPDRRIFVLLHDENFPAAQKSLIQTIIDTTRKLVDGSDHSKTVREAMAYEKQNTNPNTEEFKRLGLGLFITTLYQPVNKNCSSCGKPATRKCARCETHVYCDAMCQKAHWRLHRMTCKTKDLDKIMGRAGVLLQKMYLMFCRTTFRSEVTKIEESERLLTIHMSENAPTKFVPFPDHLVTNGKDREMVLCAS
jgi:hypothetical protein